MAAEKLTLLSVWLGFLSVLLGLLSSVLAIVAVCMARKQGRIQVKQSNEISTQTETIRAQHQDIRRQSRNIEHQSKQIDEQTDKIKQIHDSLTDMSRVLHLHDYVKMAGIIYRKDGLDRVVTSLSHWVCRGDYESFVVEGIKLCTANELIFVGSIDWNHYLPGVIWRFLKVREHSKTKVRILHVDKEVGLQPFVVSRNIGIQEHPEIPPGDLLLGIPATSSIKMYGSNIGENSPIHVHFYNFLCDALVCPRSGVRRALPEFYRNSGIQAPQITLGDGLERILDLPEIKRILREDTHDARHDDARSVVVEKISGTLVELLGKVSNPEEREIAMHEENVVKIVTDFVYLLAETGIIVENRTDLAAVRFDLGREAKCSSFFGK